MVIIIIIIIVFDLVLTRSSPVSSQDLFCSLPRDQSRDASPRLGVFVILQSTSFHVYIFIPVLLLRLCSNGCAEALVVCKNPLLNRLTVV